MDSYVVRCRGWDPEREERFYRGGTLIRPKWLEKRQISHEKRGSSGATGCAVNEYLKIRFVESFQRFACFVKLVAVVLQMIIYDSDPFIITDPLLGIIRF